MAVVRKTLPAALMEHNLKADICTNLKVIGQETDVAGLHMNDEQCNASIV